MAGHAAELGVDPARIAVAGGLDMSPHAVPAGVTEGPGASTGLHVHRGAPYGFQELAPDTDVARRSTTDRIRVLTSL